MAYLTKASATEAIGGYLTADVPTPEWGGADAKVMVRELSAKEMTALAAVALEKGQELGLSVNELDGLPIEAMIDLFPSIVSWAVIDPETGTQLFTLAEVEAMAGRFVDVMRRIVEKAIELSTEEGAGEGELDPQ